MRIQTAEIRTDIGLHDVLIHTAREEPNIHYTIQEITIVSI
jgi:hypothetical protein